MKYQIDIDVLILNAEKKIYGFNEVCEVVVVL
jgi:hypothetical protein